MSKLVKLTEPLSHDDIEVFPKQIFVKNGVGTAMCLCYKTARVDTKRLNDAFGEFGWTNEYYYDQKGLLVCKIGIYDREAGHWAWKEDVGIESDYEKEKGNYSDAFKRAGFKIGIGMELYSEHFKKIFIKLDNNEWFDKGGKPKPSPYLSFSVKSVYPLIIVDSKGNERFRRGGSYNNSKVTDKPAVKPAIVKAEKPVVKVEKEVFDFDKHLYELGIRKKQKNMFEDAFPDYRSLDADEFNGIAKEFADELLNGVKSNILKGIKEGDEYYELVKNAKSIDECSLVFAKINAVKKADELTDDLEKMRIVVEIRKCNSKKEIDGLFK